MRSDSSRCSSAHPALARRRRQTPRLCSMQIVAWYQRGPRHITIADAPNQDQLLVSRLLAVLRQSPYTPSTLCPADVPRRTSCPPAIPGE